MPVELTRPINQVWQNGVEVDKDFTRTLAGDLVTAINEEESARIGLRDATAITLVGIGGTADSITASLPEGLGLTTVPVGMPLALRAVGTNTGPVDLTIPGAPPHLPVLDGQGRALQGGELSGSTPLIVRLSGSSPGTEYRVLSSLVHPADLADEALARGVAITALAGVAAIALTNIAGTPNEITAELPAQSGLAVVPLGLPLALRGPGSSSDVSTDDATLSIAGAPPDLPILDGKGRPIGRSGEINGSTPLIVRLSGSSPGTEYRVLSSLVHPADLEATNRVAEDAFATGVLGGEFHGAEDEPVAAILGEGGASLATWDARGRMLTQTEAEFYGDGDEISLAHALDDGRTLFAWDAQGRMLTQTEADFYGDEDDISLACVLGDGRIILAWDLEGAMIGGATAPATPTEPGSSGYLSGGNLRIVNADDQIAAPLGAFEALAIMPGSATSVRAVIDQPALGATRTVSAGMGWLVPDADKVLHAMPTLGQSLGVGSQSATSLISIASAYPEALMFTRVDGLSDVRMGLTTQGSTPRDDLDPADLVGFEPLVARIGQGTGSRGETPLEAMSATLARQARELGTRFRTLSFAAAMGGTPYSGLKKGTQVYGDFLRALTRAQELASAQGWRVIVDACFVKHGEADQSSAAYLADLLEWQADIDADVKAITGQQADVHFLFSQPSSHTTATPNAILAMLEAHNTSPVHHLVGPDYPFGSAYASDYLHMTGPGYFWIGEQAARGWKQALWSSHRKSRITQIVSGSRVGDSVVLDYEVPTPPLVIDTSLVTDPGQRGFRFFDGPTEIAITDVAITGPAQVTLTLASAPAGTGGEIRYALTPQPGTRSAAGIPRGNLRDSAVDISPHQNCPLHNWAVHQSFNL